MAATTDRAERLANLLALLSEARAPLTAEQIFGELGGQYPEGPSARRQAFERDKATLRDLGVPIETEVLGGSDAGRTVYSIDKARYELQALDLDPDETRALQLAVAAIRSGTGFGTDAMIKLGAGATDVEVAVSANVPTLAALPPLREAIAARHPVTFEYRDRARRIDPVRFVAPFGILVPRRVRSRPRRGAHVSVSIASPVRWSSTTPRSSNAPRSTWPGSSRPTPSS